MDWNVAATVGVALFTLALIMIRPKKINEAMTALLGAILMLALGRVGLGDATRVLADKWDVFLFFLGLMTIAAVADNAGFFDWTAAVAGQLAGGSGLRLFLNVCILGVIISTFLSNDATALILTPVVFTLVSRLNLPVLPFMFACTFLADTASFSLPVSNPINILVGGTFPQTQGLGNFWLHLLIPSLLAITLNIGLFVLLFRKQIPKSFDLAALEKPRRVIEVRGAGFFKYCLVCLCLIAVGYVVGSLLRIPLSLVAISGAILLVGGAIRFDRFHWPKLRQEISWSIFIFIGGMFIVVRGIENIGFTAQVGQWLVAIIGTSSFLAVMVGTFGTAIGTNFINNVPMALLAISVLEQLNTTSLSSTTHTGLIYSVMLGADLGPNLTTVGSLATVLWLLILRRKGLEISAFQYFKLGLIATPLMLLVAALALWVSLLI